MSGINWQRLLPFGVMAIVVVTWVARADLVSKLQQKGAGELNFDKPIFIAWVTFSSYALFLPLYYLLKHLHDKKQQQRLLKRGLRSDESGAGKSVNAYADTDADADVEGGLHEADLEPEPSSFPTIREHIKQGALLSTFFFVCVFTYTVSLSQTTVSVNTVIYNSQCVVVFFISVVLLREKMNAKKLISVFVSMGGVVMVAVFSKDSDDDDDEANKDKVKTTAFGIMAVVISMLAYAVYQVLYKLITEPPANPTKVGMFILRLALPASARSTLFRLLRSPSSTHHTDGDEHDSSYNHSDKNGHGQRAVTLMSPLRESYGGVDRSAVEDDADADAAEDASPAVVKVKKSSSSSSLSSSSSSSPSSSSSEHENALSILYMGLFGTMGCVAYWPIILICHYSGYETLEFPTGHVAWVFALTVVLDAIMNVSILLCITLSSPLFVTCGTLLTIPVSVLADRFLNDYSMAWPCYVGVALIVSGFFGLTFSKEPGDVVIG